MQALATAMSDYRKAHPDGEPSLSDCGSPEGVALQRAAEEWAVFALRTYTGENLQASLRVSEALCGFVHQISK